MQRILLLDNYDSFTYNLYHYLCHHEGVEVEVRRNDEIQPAYARAFDTLVLSPGPGLPEAAGIMPELIAGFYHRMKILGVCLGHQALGQFFGAELQNMPAVMHGRQTDIYIRDPSDPLFRDIPLKTSVGRYHSWTLSKKAFPAVLQVSAEDINGDIMAFRHRQLPVWGVQFHPESVMTPLGKTMIANFLKA